MARCVILWHHSIPHAAALGGDHFDWMFEDPANPDRGLITFRVTEALDLSSSQTVMATRGQDHRRDYLDYEGEISGARGVVTRVASGECLSVTDGPQRFEALVRFDGLGTIEHRFEGTREDHSWTFTIHRTGQPRTV